MASSAPPAQPWPRRLEQGAGHLDSCVEAIGLERVHVLGAAGRPRHHHHHHSAGPTSAAAGAAEAVLASQGHANAVCEFVAWVQLRYIDGAPSELAQQRRALNQRAEAMVQAATAAGQPKPPRPSSASASASGSAAVPPLVPPVRAAAAAAASLLEL
jgi:hypothetical protein